MSKAEKAIKTGLELKKQGVRYVLGAKAKPPSVPKFLDCSGFIRYCLLSAGVKIPDGTYAQFNSSMPIELKDLKVGDLGFLQKPTDKGTNLLNNRVTENEYNELTKLLLDKEIVQ